MLVRIKTSFTQPFSNSCLRRIGGTHYTVFTGHVPALSQGHMPSLKDRFLAFL